MKFRTIAAIAAFSLTLTGCGATVAAAGSTASAASSAPSSSQKTVSADPVVIAIPDDPTNSSRALKLLETAGLITVDPDAGYSPELRDVTGYVYNVKLQPQSADTITNILPDVGAGAVNAQFAQAAGLNAKDGLIIEDQGSNGDNPYVCVIAARTADKDNPDYEKIVKAYQDPYTSVYTRVKYNDSVFPVSPYNEADIQTKGQQIVDEVDSYESSPDGKKVVKIGVCGANNDAFKAVQKLLDEENAGLYIQLVVFDSYNLPNDALNAGEIDLNAFQHHAFLQNEIDANGYDITAIGDTCIAPLVLYSDTYKTLDDLKAAAGKAA